MGEKSIHEEKISKAFSVARVFALISIVSAHIVFSSGTPNLIIRFFDVIASVGVICFLFLSGYFYKTDKFSSFWQMLKKKLFSIGLPWLVLGSFTYLYNAILSGGFGIIAYLKWIIGNRTYLYYLTVLFLCFIIFYKNNIYTLVIAMILNVVSLMLTASGLLDGVVAFLHITHYLNVFNWFGIFALGIFVGKKVSAEKLHKFLIKTRWISFALVIIAIILLTIFEKISIGYFTYLGIWFELLGTIAILGFSTVEFLYCKPFKDISNFSFSIYLVHMVVIGLIDRVYNLHFVISIFSTAMVILICYIVFLFARWFAKLIKADKIILPILGIRESKKQ